MILIEIQNKNTLKLAHMSNILSHGCCCEIITLESKYMCRKTKDSGPAGTMTNWPLTLLSRARRWEKQLDLVSPNKADSSAPYDECDIYSNTRRGGQSAPFINSQRSTNNSLGFAHSGKHPAAHALEVRWDCGILLSREVRPIQFIREHLLPVISRTILYKIT